MKKLIIIFFSIFFVSLCAHCECGCPENENLVPFFDINGNSVLVMCLNYDGLIEKNAFKGDSLALINCSAKENLLSFSGEDFFKIERWDEKAIEITRFKKILAGKELIEYPIPILKYKIVPNKKGSYEVLVYRVIAIPTLTKEDWEEIFNKAKESLENGEINRRVLGEILFSALYGLKEANTLFLNLPQYITDEKLLEEYNELLEAYNIYNNILKKGKKVFEGIAKQK